ncbi:ABC transporter permease [Pseudothermotoga elfii]
MRKLKRIGISLFSIFAAFLISAIFIAIQNTSPASVFKALYQYSTGSWFSLSSTLNTATPLILTGISAAIAFSSNVVNLGQHGQLLVGAVTTAILGVYLDLPGWIGVPVLVILGSLAGALWAGISALFKKYYKMDEFITTLMLNFISEYLTVYLVTYPFLDKKAYVPATAMIKKTYFMPDVWGINLSFLVATFVAMISYWFIGKTKLGYEFRMMGHNPNFARVGGCRTEENATLVLLYTGFLSGLAGALLILGGTQHRFMKGIGANFGWDGVMLAIIANNSVLETFFYGIFFGALKNGAIGMEFETSVPSEFVMFLEAVIVLSVVSVRSAIEYYGQKINSLIKLKKVVTEK